MRDSHDHLCPDRKRLLHEEIPILGISSLGWNGAVDMHQVGPVECSEYFAVVGQIGAVLYLQNVMQKVLNRRLGGTAHHLMLAVGSRTS